MFWPVWRVTAGATNHMVIAICSIVLPMTTALGETTVSVRRWMRTLYS
jgi:hypothetical protein